MKALITAFLPTMWFVTSLFVLLTLLVSILQANLHLLCAAEVATASLSALAAVPVKKVTHCHTPACLFCRSSPQPGLIMLPAPPCAHQHCMAHIAALL